MYRRLPGREAGFLSYSRLWLGPDHLLLVRTTGFSEEYKRFYFRDIQAIITRRTERREILNVILVFVVIVFAVFSVFAEAGGRVFCLVMIGGILVGLLVNWLRGPTCVCHLSTAVQSEELSPIKRFRTVQKVVGQLKPRLEEAQGPLAPELLQPRPPLVSSATSTATPPQPAGQPASANDSAQ